MCPIPCQARLEVPLLAAIYYHFVGRLCLAMPVGWVPRPGGRVLGWVLTWGLSWDGYPDLGSRLPLGGEEEEVR